MISEVIRIGLFGPLDIILKLEDEEEKRQNFRTTRLQLQNVVYCFAEKFQIPGLYSKSSVSGPLYFPTVITAVNTFTKVHFFVFGLFFLILCGDTEAELKYVFS